MAATLATDSTLAALRARLAGDPAERPEWDDVACPRCQADGECPQWCVDGAERPQEGQEEVTVVELVGAFHAVERDYDDGEWYAISPVFPTQARVRAELLGYSASFADDLADGHVRIVPVVTADEQQEAVERQCWRIDAVEEWARDIDAVYGDNRFPSAMEAVRAAEKAWGDAQPCEDDGPVMVACYARNLEAAVDDVVEDIAGLFQHDPRNRRTNGGHRSALDVPAELR